MRRLLFALSLFCVVAAVGGWSLGADSEGTAPSGDGKSAVAAGVTVAGDESPEAAGSSSQPCIVRTDCAGGGLLVGQPLVVPAVLLVMVALVLVGRAPWTVATLHPALLAARLDRPPRLSS